jgi:outer membrane protein TolC
MAIGCLPAHFAQAQYVLRRFMPEQGTIYVRDPAGLPQYPIPDLPPPATVARPGPAVPAALLSLDEAIQITLRNSEVVRVLAGVGSAPSGSTIYDPAITNTTIDQQRARFDPTIDVQNTFDHFETPRAVPDLVDPTLTNIVGGRTDDYNLGVALSETTILGGQAQFRVDSARSRFAPGVFPLDPEARSSMALSYTQPLLRGAGTAANLAPIVLARIDTERSFFQFKDSVQESVRGVIAAYWNLVFARVDVWAREQQVEQGSFAYQRASANRRAGRVSVADEVQAQSALENFRANLITAQANLLNAEAALRSIMFIPPNDPTPITPVTPPTDQQIDFDWISLMTFAQERRPDLIELKLILEADQQFLIQAENDALPSVDAVMLYRWNGLEGEMPSGGLVSSGDGQYTDWTLGVNFSVPLGLRQARAALRRQELLISRDRANLEQGLHSAAHTIAANLRNLDQFYRQYEAYRATRQAAEVNLEAQFARYREQLTDFLNVLLAITDWGNAVSREAQGLAQYNIELANLERQTGAILETHGVRFVEERFGAIGPLGRLHAQRFYPSAIVPLPGAASYPTSDRPSEDFFDLTNPVYQMGVRSPSDAQSPEIGPVDPAGAPPMPPEEVVPLPTPEIPLSQGRPPMLLPPLQ